VTSLKVGDKVSTVFHQKHIYGPLNPEGAKSGLGGAIDGCLREYAVFAEEGVVKAPSNLNFEEAASLPCAAVTAWNALYGNARPLKAGDVVLVQGTGGVSVFALQVRNSFQTLMDSRSMLIFAVVRESCRRLCHCYHLYRREGQAA
jgi:NADPH:quinone reductase-like Zn-dependent oxidoreductase